MPRPDLRAAAAAWVVTSVLGCYQARLATQSDGEAQSADTTGNGGSGGSSGSGGGNGSIGSGGSGGNKDAGVKADVKADAGKPDTTPADTGPPDPTFFNVYDIVLRSCRRHHTNGCSQGGLNFALPIMDVYTKLLKPSGCGTLAYVEPGDPTRSLLSLILKGTVADCNQEPMPQMTTGLANDKVNGGAEQAALVGAWIAAGAKGP